MPTTVPSLSRRALPPQPRRRAKPYSNRRRAKRATDPIPKPVHTFDQLPWISALDTPSTSLWDIADLSQLPDPPSSPSIRRPRRPPPPDLIQSPPPKPSMSSRAPSPPCDTPFVARPVISRPTTPLSRFIPSRVLFHNLMPVLCESPYDNSPHDKFNKIYSHPILSMAETRVANFGAGPSALPESVLAEAAKGLLNFNGTGIGIAEISHRSKEFNAYIKDTVQLIREALDVPPTHEVLLMQGGGTGQFSAVVMNLLARHRLLYPDIPEKDRVLDYVLSGSWSKAACTEAARLAPGATVRIAADSRLHSKDGKSFDGLPPHDGGYSFSPNPALIYYCENETVSGTQFSGTDDPKDGNSFPFHLLPTLPAEGQTQLLPLVADYSSSFMSRPIPRLGDHAVIYAGAQKNLGPAGTSIVIVRKDCIVDVDAAARLPGGVPVPISLAYAPYAKQDSMPNTPSVFAIYVMGLVLKRNKELGGLKYYEEFNRRKQEKVYAVLRDGAEKGVYSAKVRPGQGSWMNVTFGVEGEGAEARFIAGAEKRNLKGLKGHR
ncbi:hypothetical protein H0H92_012522, partial [Tricholoma furcatifolium]